MANRKSASKQAVQGGTSRSQPANENRSANTGNSGKASSKPPTSNQPSSSKPQNRTAPKPPQPQVAANRSSYGTASQGTGSGAPKSQGANGLNRIFGGAEATSGHKASQDRSMAPKRGNNPQKGHTPVPQPNISRTQLQPPKTGPPKPRPSNAEHFQSVTGGRSPALNSVSQKAQSKAPTLQRPQTHQQSSNSGKNATNGSQMSMQHTPRRAFKLGEPAKGFESPSYNHKATSLPHPAQGMSNKGHKDNPPKSVMSDWSLRPTNTPLPTKNVPSPPPVKTSPGSKGTGNRLSDSMNPSGSKRTSSGLHQANMSVKQSPAAKGSGLVGWISSLLPSAGLAPVQATKKRMPDPSKATGPLNGPRTHQNQAPNLSTSKGAERGPTLPRKDSPANNKVHMERRRELGKNNVSAKGSSLAEDRFLGWTETFGPPPKKDSLPASKKMSPSILAETKGTGRNGKSATDHSPKSSGSNHLSSHPLTTDGVIARKQQPVRLAQDVSTARLSSTQSSPKSKSKISCPEQRATDPSQKSWAAAVPALSLGGLLNQVSSFFGWTEAAPQKFPINKQVQATNKPRQSHNAAPTPFASAHRASKSIKGDDNSFKSHPAPTLFSTSSGLKHTEFLSKGVALSAGSAKNGPHDIRDQSGKSNTSSGTGLSLMRSNVTLPKGQTPDRHEGTSKSMRRDAELLPVVSKHATNLGKHQLARGTVKSAKYTSVRKEEFQVRSSSSKVLSHTPEKTLYKNLLRQYSPTLIWPTSDNPKDISAYSTLAAAPIPSPPKNEVQNKVVRKTIAQNPDLFKITTPIKVKAFEKHLKDHPNQPFVKSVVRSLKNGFWPWANTSDPTFPTTYDGSRQRPPIRNKDKAKFIRQQRDEEVALGRWSKPFGTKLLPGMYSSPIGAVPKSTPGKYRIIIDQSSGPHALNSMIPKSQVKVKLDNVHDLGAALLAVRKKHPKRKLTLFKSDVRSAYRQLPIHPSWQVKQVVCVDGQNHVDRCNNLGNRGGGWNWNAFVSLVNWIGTEKKNIPNLLGYVDDNFGWEFEGKTKFYKPYKKHFPAKQTRLLELWDELGIPHDEEKQLSGPCLPILGFDVNANAMTIKVPDEKKAQVIQLLRGYAHEGTSYTLKELQSIAGSVNSAALCLYPHLRPGLRVLYDEMKGKEGPSTKLTVTKPVARSLSKLADYLEQAQPIPIRESKLTARGLRARSDPSGVSGKANRGQIENR